MYRYVEASREGDEMRAPYHYFHNYVDSERLRAHPHHAFNLEGDLLRQWDAAGVLKLCDSRRGDAGRGEGVNKCGVHTKNSGRIWTQSKFFKYNLNTFPLSS